MREEAGNAPPSFPLWRQNGETLLAWGAPEIQPMNSVLSALALGVFSATSVLAQHTLGYGNTSTSGGVLISLPVSAFGDKAGIGYGWFGKFQYGLNDDLVVLGSVGYAVWSKAAISHEPSESDEYSHSGLLILWGIRLRVKIEGLEFYATGESGLYRITRNILSKGVSLFGIETSQESRSTIHEFVIAPGVGMEFGPWEASGSYIVSAEFGNIMLRIAYIINL